MHNDEWDEVKLSECLTIKHGKNQKQVEDPEGKYPILGTGGQIGRTNSFLYDKPSVLIGRKGTINKPRYMDTPFWTVDTLFYSEIKDNALAKYIYYIFTTIDWDRYNEASGVPSLSASTISSIKITLPSKDYQAQIVAILDTWNEYLQKLNKKIEAKKSIKKGLMQRLLTGNLRLSGFKSEWLETRLGVIAKVGSGFGFPESLQGHRSKEVPFIKVSDMNLPGNETKITRWNNSITQDEMRQLKVRTFPAGAIVFPKIGAAINTNKKRLLTTPTIIDNNVMALIPNESKSASFLFHWMLAFDLKRWANDSGVPSMRKSEVEAHLIKIPADVDEMVGIGELLDAANEEIEALQRLRNDLLEQKNYLLNNLVAGRIVVPEAGEPKEALHA